MYLSVSYAYWDFSLYTRQQTLLRYYSVSHVLYGSGMSKAVMIAVTCVSVQSVLLYGTLGLRLGFLRYWPKSLLACTERSRARLTQVTTCPVHMLWA